jgi:RHS repeat-associated protein
VADLTGPAGTSLSWREYAPYGEVRLAGVGAGAPAIDPFAFTGEQRDTLTGLYHLRARQYDPTTGRFLTTDPQAPLLTDPYVASYVYVRGNPTGWVDPSGNNGEGYLESLWYIARSIVNTPWTVVGLTVSSLAGADSCALNNELVVECYGADLMPVGSAITIGNSVTTRYSAEAYREQVDVRRHENAHATQWMIPWFPLWYGLGALWSTNTTGDWFCGNLFEYASGPTPGYAHCGWPKSGASGK